MRLKLKVSTLHLVETNIEKLNVKESALLSKARCLPVDGFKLHDLKMLGSILGLGKSKC